METRKSAYYLKLSGDVKNRYDEKIQKCGEIDPYTIKPSDLSLSPKDFPDISTYDIGNYMIHTVSPYTKRFYDNYKGTEAYSFFESGFVLNIGSKKSNNSAIVKGKVKHSQRMNESPLKVWILANMDGKIICAHCTCVAGLSETCSHVGAVCFAVKNVAESSEAKSVTDVLCKWNVPSFKEVSMSSATSIRWASRSHEPTTLEASFLEHCDSITHLSDERIDQFVVKSHSDGDDTALATILFPEVRRKTNIRDEIFLASLYSENNRNKTITELVQIGKSTSLNISTDEAKEISGLTLPRLKSKCCLALRRGRITGSNFRNCCVTNIVDPSLTTIRRVINLNKHFENIPSTRVKKKAFDQYLRFAEFNHENFVYSECGLIINPEIPYFAGSPDGLVSCNCHGDGCFKTKYLSTLKSDASLESLTRKPNNILNKYGNKYSLEKNHEFFYHAQLQINVSNLKYCDFVIWSSQKYISVRVDADVEFWRVTMKRATSFHEQVVMPELLGKYYTERKDLPNSIEEENEEEPSSIEDRYEEELELIELAIEVLNSE